MIDDLANRPHDCDLLLDQNYAGHGADRYKVWVSNDCTQLLGPEFAMLHPAFREQRLAAARHREDPQAIERIFVFFGGTDPGNLTGRALEALLEPNLAHLTVDCVVGANNPYQLELASIAEQRGNAYFLIDGERFGDPTGYRIATDVDGRVVEYEYSWDLELED